MDPRVRVFYRQYLQEVEVEKLSFPSDTVLLDPMIQSQLHQYMFTCHLLYPSEGAGNLFLPRINYQKRVMKELMKRLEAAIRNPDEDEISNAWMEKMGELSTKEDPPPLKSAQTRSILTYTLPYATEDVMANAIFIAENPRLSTSAGSTGLRTWDACLHLATYLASDGRSLIMGRSVLELGAGTGLLSIICAGPLAAAYVLATDGDEDVDKRIEGNIGLNHHLPRRSGRRIPLEAKVLKWGSSETLGSVLPSKGGNVLYDTILGADLTYSLDSLDPLASTISGLAELCPTAEIVISAPMRDEDMFDLFLAHCLNHGLSVYDIDFRCPRFELQRGFFHSLDPPIRIVRIRRELTNI